MTMTAIEPGVVAPSAVSSGTQSASYKLGSVLLEIVHRAGIYARESDLHAAEQVVRDWVRAMASSGLSALVTGEERAPIEDVSKRTPPGGFVPVPAAAPQPSIDYDKLAAALMRQRDAAQVKAVTPKPEQPIL